MNNQFAQIYILTSQVETTQNETLLRYLETNINQSVS